MPTTTKKTRKPVYEPVLKLPALPYEQFVALRDNIAVHGVLVPILVDETRRTIDGNYRKAIADELGYDCPEIVQSGLTDEEKRTLARALNLARRQLTQEQKRQLVADQLQETPDRSNRWVGTGRTSSFARGRAGRPTATAPSPRPLTREAEQRPSTVCRFRLAAIPVQGISIQL